MLTLPVLSSLKMDGSSNFVRTKFSADHDAASVPPPTGRPVKMVVLYIKILVMLVMLSSAILV